jgi:hypothetical protein
MRRPYYNADVAGPGDRVAISRFVNSRAPVGTPTRVDPAAR